MLEIKCLLCAKPSLPGLPLTRLCTRVQANLLASGGGTADRCIKFWNTHTGALLNSIDTSSQARGPLPLRCPALRLHSLCLLQHSSPMTGQLYATGLPAFCVVQLMACAKC